VKKAAHLTCNSLPYPQIANLFRSGATLSKTKFVAVAFCKSLVIPFSPHLAVSIVKKSLRWLKKLLQIKCAEAVQNTPTL
jgi:hypothetical protein